MPTWLVSDRAVHGPFGGDVSFGSDPRSQILLAPPALAVHARLTVRPGGWVLHPGAPGAQLFVSRRQARHAPVSGPVQLGPGDRITLYDRTGPTFELANTEPAGPKVVAAPAPPPAPSRPANQRISGPTRPARPSGRQMPTAGALANEARRQAEVELMRVGPIQRFVETWFRFRSGSLFQPRYIVAALFAAAGGAFVTCSAVAAWIWAHM